MSEHRYYEFRSIDEPLTKQEQQELRNISSRTDITPHRFVNEYDWGDLSGEPIEMLERYFDVYLHVTDYGSRALGCRLPERVVSREMFEDYEIFEEPMVRFGDEYVVVLFQPRIEPGDDPEWWRHEESMEEFSRIREQLMQGDPRALYLGWLGSVYSMWLSEETIEPPVPAGLDNSGEPLESLLEFLMLEESLLEVAAEESPEVPEEEQSQPVREWIDGLADEQRTDWLLRALEGDRQLSAEMKRAYREDGQGESWVVKDAGRTVGELLGVRPVGG